MGYASSFVIGILAIAGQFLAPEFPQQGLDLIDSFFIYALLAQFTHLGWAHLVLNLLGLLIVNWGFTGQCTTREWAAIQLASLLWVAFYLSGVERLDWYCGLSGALHFQFACCLLLAFSRSAHGLRTSWPLWVLLAGLCAKLLLEWHSGPSTDALVGGPVAHAAHRGGALGGFLLGLLMLAWSFFSRRRYCA